MNTMKFFGKKVTLNEYLQNEMEYELGLKIYDYGGRNYKNSINTHCV
jgi:hypothetical protein